MGLYRMRALFAGTVAGQVRFLAPAVKQYGLRLEDFLAVLQAFGENPVENIVLEACLKYQVTPDDLLGEVQQAELGG